MRQDITLDVRKREISAGRDVAYWLGKGYDALDRAEEKAREELGGNEEV